MFRVFDVPGNRQWLDGGAMFGNAPRTLWSQWYPVDARGRIELQCRALLADTGELRVLFETGIGAFFEPRLKERYGVVEDEHVLLSSLAKLGLEDRDIDYVVLSHLHFDHAGGLLRAYRANEPNQLLFPRARFVVSRTAFERAEQPHPRDRASFIVGLPDLLRESGRLILLDDPAGERLPFGERLTFFESGGHTPGMLHSILSGNHHDLLFCADLIPGRAWVPLPITMGYDRFPERLIDEKAALYSSRDLERTWFFYTHDVEASVSRIGISADGRYQAQDPVATLGSGWDLDSEAAPG